MKRLLYKKGHFAPCGAANGGASWQEIGRFGFRRVIQDNNRQGKGNKPLSGVRCFAHNAGSGHIPIYRIIHQASRQEYSIQLQPCRPITLSISPSVNKHIW